MYMRNVFPQLFELQGALENPDFRFKACRAWLGIGYPFRAFLSMVQALGEIAIFCVYLTRYFFYLPFFWIGNLIYCGLSDEETDEHCEEFIRLRQAQEARADEKERRKEAQRTLSKAS